MTGVRTDAPRDMREFVVDTRKRIVALERRQGGSGGGGGGGGGDAVFAAGTVSAWSGTPANVPSGWILCDGRALSRVGYPYLYAAIGTTYGAGDGTTTFNVPNGKGRVIVGQDGAQVEFDVVGETGGAKSTTLVAGNLPRHTHPLGRNGGNVGYSEGSTATRYTVGFGNTRPEGDVASGYQDEPTSVAFNNLQPYIVQNWIISTGAGSSSSAGAVVPVQLWQEFKMASAGGALRPQVSGRMVWDGVVTGTLGATLSADKTTITVPSAGTYRVTQNIGIGTTFGGAANMNAVINGAQYNPSLVYGTSGPAGSFNAVNEFYFTVPAPGTLYLTANAPAGGMYDWSWFRIEKQEPFFPQSALTVNQGTSAQRDAIYGVPADNAAMVSLANRQVEWFNTDRGWMESYYATAGSTGLTVPGRPTTGWRPVSSQVGVIPASVASWPTGAFVQYGNQVNFTAITALSLNGVFSAAWANDYVIECVITSATQGGYIRMRKANVDTVGPTYGNQELYNNSANSIVTGYTAVAGWGYGVSGQHAKFTAKITNAPVPSGTTCYLDLSTVVQQAGWIVNSTNKGTHNGNTYDGFSIVPAAGSITGWLRVYALS